MKISKLIKKLQEIENQNLEVYLSSDPEGNSFHKLTDVYNVIVDKENDDYGFEVNGKEVNKGVILFP